MNDPWVEEWEEIEPERYELREEPRYRFDVSRRAFVQTVGAGLLFTSMGGVALAQRRRGGSPVSIEARLHIGEDGTITVMTGKVEVGQGSRTQITQAAAEELGVQTSDVQLVMADTGLVPNDGGTFGSLTTPRTIPAVRQAAAAARERLKAIAAESWGLKPEQLTTADGAVHHASSNKQITYAELVHGSASKGALSGSVERDIDLTPIEDWKILGTPVSKVGASDVVTGAHRYPSDIVRPGMLYGSVLRPPSYGAELEDIDLSVVRDMKGVVVARDGSFVGCAAPTAYAAQQAVEKLRATARWSEQSHVSSTNLYSHLKDLAEKTMQGGRKPRGRETGEVEPALADAAKKFSAAFEVPYIQHAPMEPRAAMAEWTNGSLTVWTGTQRPYGVKSELTRAFSLAQDKVRVIVPDTGGGFGGKHTGDAAIEAARLAQEAKRPVSLRWTREEEFTWAYFRPAGLIEISAGTNTDGRIVAWDFMNINSGGSALESPYAIPNMRARFVACDSPLREGSYRSLAATANTFAREAFMDELAAEFSEDPLEYRLRHLEKGRFRDVLSKAAEAFGWSDARKNAAPNTGVGLSCGTDKGSYTAACAEVEVDPKTGRYKVRRVVQAFECGAIQNPQNLRAQVEGCLVMGLGAALREEIRFENGRITNATFKGYEVPRFTGIPHIEIVLVNRPDLRSAGAGETPIIAIAPAIANALRQATGARHRSIPLREKTNIA